MQRPAPRHRHTELQACGAEDASLEQEGETAEAALLVRRATRGARAVATVALLVAALSSAGSAILLLKVSGGPAHAGPQQALGLNSDGDVFDHEDAIPGYYRAFQSTPVRQGRDMGSPIVSILSLGERVFVTERHGHRVRIETPVDGWMSTMAVDGSLILRRDAAMAGVRARPNASAMTLVAASRRVQDGVKDLRRSVAVFDGLERRLLGTLRGVADGVVSKPMSDGVKALKNADIKGTGDAITRGANRLSKDAEAAMKAPDKATEHRLTEQLGQHARAQLAETLDATRLFREDGNKIIAHMQKVFRT